MTKNNTNKGGYKSEGKYTKPAYPFLHLFTLQLHFSVRKTQGCGFVYLLAFNAPELGLEYAILLRPRLYKHCY